MDVALVAGEASPAGRGGLRPQSRGRDAGVLRAGREAGHARVIAPVSSFTGVSAVRR